MRAKNWGTWERAFVALAVILTTSLFAFAWVSPAFTQGEDDDDMMGMMQRDGSNMMPVQEMARETVPGEVVGAPNPAMVTAGGDARWILPGPRALDPDLFGTPDQPLGFDPAVGVPIEQRRVSGDGESFTTTRGPTAHSDQWQAISGSARAEVVDITTVSALDTRDRIDATFEFTSPDGEHEYRVVVGEPLTTLPYETFGGVALNVLLHGGTGVGTMLQPQQFTYVTFWGVGDFYVDGELVADNRVVHMMTTEKVRDENYGLVFDEGVIHDDYHMHLLMPPLEVTEDGPQNSPVPTNFTLPNGQQQPFLHIMYEQIEQILGDVTGMGQMDTDEAMDAMMGGAQALGGTAETTLLAEERLMDLPDGPLAWVAFRSSPSARMEPVTHQHSPGFLYVTRGTHTITMQGEEYTLQQGEAMFIPEGVRHTHDTQGRFAEILLTAPDSDAPQGMDEARRVFASDVLEGVPEAPVQARFIAVDLPPSAQTSIHTHPGSEFICVSRGDIEYENEEVGTITLEAGECHMLPAGVAVQKRNPEGGDARFLSWFLVDPDEPFSSEASFDE